jgi:hypothetical protein
MAFNKKVWLPRIVPYPGRRRLLDTETVGIYDVIRAEGTPTQEGDSWSSIVMNDMENRIEAGLEEKLDKTSVVNNFATTDPTMAAAAPLARELKEDVNRLNNSLTDVGSATLLGELTTTAPGTIPGSITPYRFIVLDVGYGGGVHKKFTYPVGVMLTGELVEEKHYASTTYSMSIQFYLSGGQYIYISSLVLVGWSFDNIRLYGIK